MSVASGATAVSSARTLIHTPSGTARPRVVLGAARSVPTVMTVLSHGNQL
ncbi:hypothetical protein GCM10025792_42570 [Pseudonocardia tropica]